MTASPPPNDTPFVIVSAICEGVLTEVDNVVSAIRIVDKVTSKLPPPEMIPAGVKPMARQQLWYLLMLRGIADGKHHVRIALESPSGEQQNYVDEETNFESEATEIGGANFALHLNLGLTEIGYYWFRTYWDGTLIANAPLLLIFEDQAGTSTA